MMNVKRMFFCVSVGIFFCANVNAMLGLQRSSQVGTRVLLAVQAPRRTVVRARYSQDVLLDGIGAKASKTLDKLKEEMDAMAPYCDDACVFRALREQVDQARGYCRQRNREVCYARASSDMRWRKENPKAGEPQEHEDNVRELDHLLIPLQCILAIEWAKFLDRKHEESCDWRNK